MTPEDVKRFYGNQYNFRKVTGMSSSTLGNWLKWGFVPEDAQYKLERLTKGALKVNVDEDMPENRIYLGDGIYVQFEEDGLRLQMSNHSIFISHEFFECLNKFYKDYREAK